MEKKHQKRSEIENSENNFGGLFFLKHFRLIVVHCGGQTSVRSV